MAVGGKFFFSFFHFPPHRRSLTNHAIFSGKGIHLKLADTLYTRCDQKVPRLIFYWAVDALRDTPVCRVVS